MTKKKVAFVLGVIALTGCGRSQAPSVDGLAKSTEPFAIPSAAFTNELGKFPAVADCAGALPNSFIQPLAFVDVVPPNEGPCPAGDTGTNAFAYNNPAAQPGLGVPLGGVGAGSFMINQAGSFGPWDFAGAYENNNGPNTQFEDRILPQAAFHIREQVGDGAATVKTLAVNAAPWNQLPSAWSPLQVGDGTYSALWPFGWETFKPFAAGVSMRFWSPIVAGNDELTSMPVAYFDVRVTNTTDKTDRLSVMFTFPNAAEHDAVTVRKGLSSRVTSDNGITGVTLSASSPDNTPDAQDSEWTIAAHPASGQQASYVTSWKGDGDGGDIYGAFSKTGQLPNRALDDSASAGAIAVSVTLKPGESATIPFVLAWDFPEADAPSSDTCGATATVCEVWSRDPTQYFMRRYTSYFGARETPTNDYVAGSYPFHQSFAIADRMLSEHDSALSSVEGWWKRIANEPAYPDWLVRLALNEEIQMVFNVSFWESGLITNTPSPTTRIGSAIPDTHLFCTSTGGNWDNCNEWDTDAWGYLAEVLLWPNLERDRLRGVLQEKIEGIDGVGETGATHNAVTDSAQPTVGRLQFSDVPMATIFRSYTYYRRTGDADFLKYAYPVMLQLMQGLQVGIHAPDHFPLDPPGQEDSYDAWHAEVHNVYNAELWLLTEEVMIDATHMARQLGVKEASESIEKQLVADLPQAKQQFETMFWNPVLNHYTMDPMGAGYQGGYFVDTFFAQQIAYTLGLPALVPLDHEVQHLLNAYPQQMQKSINGHFVGPPNMVPDVGPPNATMQPIEEEEIWPGSAMEYAGTYLQAAQASGNTDLAAKGYSIAQALEYWMIEDVSLGFMFEQPGGWQWNAPMIYRSPSFNQERTTLGVLHTIKPIVDWAVPPPSADLYGG